MNLKIISAGAGAGKTYRLTSEMVALLAQKTVRPSGIIATTFTRKAAAELQERVRVRLLEDGLSIEANELGNALIGTVHGLGVKLLKRFAYEAGVSPETDIVSDDDQQVMFNRSLSVVISKSRVAMMEQLSERLGFKKSIFNSTDWRRWLKDLTEVLRANNMSAEAVEQSKIRSWESFSQFLDTPIDRSNEEWNQKLTEFLEDTITILDNNEDSTKKTADANRTLRELLGELNLRGELFWHQWVKISKIGVGAKSRDDVNPLTAFADSHLGHSAFHQDIKSFIFNIFELAEAAIAEFDRYKKSRGLIDYTDMEVLVNHLLDSPTVQKVLEDELDLLMVDEFQDTSPLQLEIFLKLSKYAQHSIWVGDPKQSIYGFRGAEPALMQAIVQAQGGLKKENILQYSWRSREDIVHATNAIFTQSFSELPMEQVALLPKRCKKATDISVNRSDELPEMQTALHHWNFTFDGEGRKPGQDWLTDCIASELAKTLEKGILISPKGEEKERHAVPGDVAILCRSNGQCQKMAEALHRAGMKAAISRAGLLSTAEAKLILACLKFVLNRFDSLSVAEILRLGARLELKEIIEDRLEYLQNDLAERNKRWATHQELIQKLDGLRNEVTELSSAEILTLLLEELDLRRLVITWGNVEQRLANVDELVRLSLQYEEVCNRLHTAASLGGFLLWLSDLENEGLDKQGSGENPQAVNVLTYHRSKGLEYPILICQSLESKLRDDVWGLELVADKDKVNLDNLLCGRWVRLWANPYSDLFRKTTLAERIAESDVSLAKRQRALEEEARLLYVGITRARDYLIFPSYHHAPKWLNRVCGKGQEDFPALDASLSLTTWEWNGESQEISTSIFSYPKDFGHAETHIEKILSLPESGGKLVHEPFAYDISIQDTDSPELINTFNYAAAFSLPEIIERKSVGKALRAFQMASTSGLEVDEKLKMAQGLLSRFEIQDLLEADAVVQANEGWENWLLSEFSGTVAIYNYPIRAKISQRLFETNVDLVLIGSSGVSMVIFSPFVGNSKSRAKKLKEMTGYLKSCQGVLNTLENPKGAPGVYVNFVLDNLVVRIK